MGLCITREVEFKEDFQDFDLKSIRKKQLEYNSKKNYCVEGECRRDMLISITANQRKFNEVIIIQKMKRLRKELRDTE
jgi:hypothetical protein